MGFGDRFEGFRGDSGLFKARGHWNLVSGEWRESAVASAVAGPAAQLESSMVRKGGDGSSPRVPAAAAGQIVAVIVMLLGIGFVTVITASITSSFVAPFTAEQQAVAGDGVPATESLKKIDERLARIEAALNDRS
jgi:hypothetical protein